MALGASVRNALTLWRMPSRVTMAVLAIGLFLLIASWLIAHRAAAMLADSLRWFGTPEYAATSVGLGGSLEYRGFRLHAIDADAPELFAADRVRVETPGLHWLVWYGLFGGPSSGGLADFMGASGLSRVQNSGGTPRAVPPASRLAFSIEGLVAGRGLSDLGDLRWFGLASGAPLDAEGCDGRRRFVASDLVAMGLGEGATRVEGSFQVNRRDTAEISLRIERPSTSRSELMMRVRADDVRKLPDSDWAQLVILERRWVVRDEGFVSARNRWCASRMGVSRDGFVERHLAAIKRELSTVGATPAEDLESAYRRYAARGGEITWHSRPNLTTPLGQLARFTPAERLRILNASLESVRGRAAQFRFEFAPMVPPPGPPAAPVDAATLANAGATAAPGPTAEVPPAADPAPLTAAPVPPPVPAPLTPPVPMPEPRAAPVGLANPVVAAEPPPQRVPEIGGPSPTVAAAPTSMAPPMTTPSRVPGGTDALPRANSAASSTGLPGRLASVRPLPPVGGSMVYADLRGLEGRRIEVESVYGSVRRGTLEKYTDTAITVRLEQRERGLSVTMPQQTVREVRLLDSRPLLIDPPVGG